MHISLPHRECISVSVSGVDMYVCLGKEVRNGGLQVSGSVLYGILSLKGWWLTGLLLRPLRKAQRMDSAC